MTENQNFGQAIEVLKQGKRVARHGWNGKGMWLKLVAYYTVDEDLGAIWGQDVNVNGFPLLPWIGMRTADNKFVPWLASQTDILAEDWVILD
jgi:hypothetical protein